MIAFNFRTNREEHVPDGFAGMTANQVFPFLPPTDACRLGYTFRLAEGLDPLTSWLRIVEAGLHLNIRTAA